MSKARKICSLKIQGNNGRELVGTAAQLHLISSRGGWDVFVRELGAAIGQAVAVQMSDALIAQAPSLPPTETLAPKERRMESRIGPMAVAERTQHVH